MPSRTRLRLISWTSLLLTSVVSGGAADPAFHVTVNSGAMGTTFAPVSFELPQGVRSSGRAWEVVDSAGRTTPLQIDGDGRGWWLPNSMGAYEQQQLSLKPVATPGKRIQSRDDDGALRFNAGGQELFAYQMAKTTPPGDTGAIYERGGYLYPVYTPAGRLVVDDYPPAHLHHHGIWFPWTKTEFEGRHPDFWNMGAGTGTVEFVGLDNQTQGGVFAGFQSRHRFVDLTAPAGRRVALNETWTVRAFAPRPDSSYWVMDLESVQTCATDEPLILPEYRYGGIGVRGHHEWDGAENAKWLTANGETDRVKAHATTARWCHFGGAVENEFAGIAILCHPGNYRYPQPMRVHPTEPFFCYAPQQAGDMAIEPGREYVSRYRFVFADGKPDAALLNRLWHDYANPPRVTVAAGR